MLLRTFGLGRLEWSGTHGGRGKRRWVNPLIIEAIRRSELLDPNQRPITVHLTLERCIEWLERQDAYAPGQQVGSRKEQCTSDQSSSEEEHAASLKQQPNSTFSPYNHSDQNPRSVMLLHTDKNRLG